MRIFLRAVALWRSTNQAVDLWRAYSVVAMISRHVRELGYDPSKFVWPPTPEDGNKSQMGGVNDLDKHRAS